MVPALVIGSVVVLVFFAELMWARHVVQRRHARGVVRALREPGAKHRVTLGMLWNPGAAWNPAKPLGLENPVWGPGVGTYWMDGAGLVHLEWTPRGGRTEYFVGPVPEAIVNNPRGNVQARNGALAACGVYLLFVLVGFALGFALTSGTASQRATVGAICAFLAYALAYFVLLTVGAALRRRLARGGAVDG